MMKNEEILKKVIEKAVKNGFDASYFDQEGYDLETGKHEKITYKDVNLSEAGTYLLIFSHDFLKAFFGKHLKEKGHPLFDDSGEEIGWKGNGQYYYEWQYHGQQMVLEKEPLKYLEKFL